MDNYSRTISETLLAERREKLKRSAVKWTLLIAMTILAIFYFYPFLVVIFNSFKSNDDFSIAPFAPPEAGSGTTESLLGAARAMSLRTALVNSVVVTVVSNVLIALFSSLTAWMLVRFRWMFSKIILGLFIAGLIIPFQALMLPLVQHLLRIDLLRNIGAMIISYLGFGMAFSVFMFHGFIKQVPKEIEESAKTVGASPLRVYFQVILPIIRPIMITILILNTLWIWNDFLLPYVIAARTASAYTLPVALYTGVIGTYNKQYASLMAGLFLMLIPSVIFYMFAQRYIVGGLSGAAIK